MAGMITGAWEQPRERVRELIFIDSKTPADGESHFDNMIRYGGNRQWAATAQYTIEFCFECQTSRVSSKPSERNREDHRWRYFEIDTHHDAMYEDPEGFVDIITLSEE